MPLLGCFHGVAKAMAVQPPKGGKGRLVDLEQPAPAEWARPMKCGAGRDRRQRRVFVQDEKVEVLVYVEPRFQETDLLIRG